MRRSDKAALIQMARDQVSELGMNEDLEFDAKPRISEIPPEAGEARVRGWVPCWLYVEIDDEVA